jgi:hypothetical protein
MAKPREVNVYFNNWHATGLNIQVPQYEVDLTVQWIDNVGVSHTHTETVKFPNALAGLTTEEQKEVAIDIMLKEVRSRLGAV